MGRQEESFGSCLSACQREQRSPADQGAAGVLVKLGCRVQRRPDVQDLQVMSEMLMEWGGGGGGGRWQRWK
eukprot:764785-Hanusia_phi.AAC.2